MFDKIWRITIIVIFALTGLVLGFYLTPFVSEIIEPKVFDLGLFSVPLTVFLACALGILVFVLLGYVLAPFILKYIYKVSEAVFSVLSAIPTSDIVIGALGLIIALILANLLGNAVSSMPFIGSYLPLLLNVVFGIVGVKLALEKKKDIMLLTVPLYREIKGKKMATSSNVKKHQTSSKILDTSVIIDGRIADICKTNFIEGEMLVPNFVLEELQQIADSSDTIKRNRGRRGLDILQEMQGGECANITVINNDFDDISEVDAKLIRLGQELDACVVTNDYNLNKVAVLQGVKVLNINELANAVKTVVIPGEEMFVSIVKEGKESNQGIAYLNDGTMIVVEGAKKRVGEMLDVVVTSVLQTPAGKMIFAKIR